MTPGLSWQLLRFEALGVQRLYELLQLRCRVFILEQGAFLDPDGVDDQCNHLLGHAHPGGPLLAYLRIVDAGVKYAEPSIGRVITAPEVRGQGLGEMLMQEGIARCRAAWPGQGIRISAQSRLERFYRRLGFLPVEQPYDEDGIPHQQMLLAPAVCVAKEGAA